MPHPKFWSVFDGFRKLVVFALGVAIIVFALVDPDSANTVTMLIIGSVMVGVLPIENVIGWHFTRKVRRQDDRAIDDR
jgi:hypothetical protein